MGKIKEKLIEIEEALDSTTLLCDDIAAMLDVPVEWVYEVVENRWRNSVQDSWKESSTAGLLLQRVPDSAV